jgi:hypothetical protein
MIIIVGLAVARVGKKAYLSISYLRKDLLLASGVDNNSSEVNLLIEN